MTKQCSRCKKIYPNTSENFPPYNRCWCRSCHRAYHRVYNRKYREQKAAQQRRYREEHRGQAKAYREEHRGQAKAYREEHRGQMSAYRKEHLQRCHEYQKEHRRQLRLEVLNHYTPDGLRCACCGEDHVAFLCLDHINGGGGQHRKSIKGTLYNWLKKHDFPDGFRVLCLNCNGALGHYGYCPHKS